MKTFIALGLLSIAGLAYATTGGPTYLSTLSYNAAENAVYYIENDYSGRGCPPIVHKINLSTLADTEVKNCDQIFKEYQGEYQDGYGAFLQDYQSGLSYSYLGSVSLKKNNIDVDVRLVSEEKFEDLDEVMWRNFQATITQNGKKLGEINFRGCYADQPHIFEGYMVPNSDAMAILISNKGDCMEGGYINETLHIVRGVQYLNTAVVRGFKTDDATEPNTANLIVSASQEAAPETGGNMNNKYLYLLPLAVAIFLGGFFLGRRRPKTITRSVT